MKRQARSWSSLLRSEHHYARSNATRALGDMKAHSAEKALVALLRGEQDVGVIEQTSLALWMLGARKVWLTE